jgi:hypothetical protein
MLILEVVLGDVAVPRGNPRINRTGWQYPKGKFITSCPARVGFEKTISPPLMACLPP